MTISISMGNTQCWWTRLFHKLMPDKSLKFKFRTCKGDKLFKNKITVRMARLRKITDCRNVSQVKLLEYCSIVTNNGKSWMSSGIFQKMDSRLKSRLGGEKYFLASNKRPAYPKVTSLKTILIFFLSLNTTSVLQPLYQGRTRVFKSDFNIHQNDQAL